MSTFLVSFGVVAATIAAVVFVALNGPDQPATIRRQPARERPSKRHRPRPARSKGRTPPAALVPSAGRQAAPAAAVPASPAPAPAAMAVGSVASAAAMPASMPPGPALALPDSDPMRLRVLPAAPTTIWVRIRSGFALVVLVVVLGALLALVVGAILVGAAFLIRSATS